MSLTKPSATESSVYKKDRKSKGESLRDAALNEVTDSDSDNYIGNSNKRSRYRSSRSYSDDEAIDMRDLVADDMTLEEERIEDIESMRYAKSLEHSQTDESWKDIPSSSRDNRHSIPVAQSQVSPFYIQEFVFNFENIFCQSINVDDDDAEATENESTNSTSGPLMSTSTVNKNTPSTSRSLVSTSSLITTVDKYVPTSDKNNRFSNPKKDLINYLQRKSEVRLRHTSTLQINTKLLCPFRVSCTCARKSLISRRKSWKSSVLKQNQMQQRKSKV